MDPALQLFIASLAIGLMLLAIEVFVPGGILGAMGGVALVVAIGAGFFAFGPQGGLLAAVALIVFGGLLFGVWIRIFPRTPMGRVLTLRKDGHAFKAAHAESAIVAGLPGTALSDLRPAGLALLNGHRTDVVSESGYVVAGTPVKVVKVTGNLIVVREASA
jgi:membrane-bound serine protease (ClpP class)